MQPRDFGGRRSAQKIWGKLQLHVYLIPESTASLLINAANIILNFVVQETRFFPVCDHTYLGKEGLFQVCSLHLLCS